MRATVVIFFLNSVATYGAIDLGKLAENSPFGAGVTTTSAAAENSSLELRGMYVDQGKTYFSIYNTTTKQSTWVVQGEAASKATEGLSVRSFDPVNSVASIDAGGKAMQVSLKQASVSKYEAPPIKTEELIPAGGNSTPPGPGQVQTPFGNFTPEQIAAFRAEREKRWTERMQQQGGVPGEAGTGESAGGGRERGGRDRGSRGTGATGSTTGTTGSSAPAGTVGGRGR